MFGRRTRTPTPTNLPDQPSGKDDRALRKEQKALQRDMQKAQRHLEQIVSERVTHGVARELREMMDMQKGRWPELHNLPEDKTSVPVTPSRSDSSTALTSGDLSDGAPASSAHT